MTSTIKVNTITTESGSTLTVGGCGKTVALASGASQTGFGRTGTVDWQTGSIKTATFTAANGEGYFADTSSGTFIMNLPAGTAGNIVSVVDYTNTFQTNALTITPNGSQKIGGVSENASLSTEGQSVTFVYVDDTEGWKNIQDSTSNVTGENFVVATGGTITTSGNDKIHTFTGPGTFSISAISATTPNNAVDYLVVAGGGSGGKGNTASAGAGGAGGLRFSASNWCAPGCVSPRAGTVLTATVASFPITIGAGGAAVSSGGVKGNNGNNSIFSTITSTAGGAGAGHDDVNGNPGGSGGGGASGSPSPLGTGGSGNTPPVSPSQGNDGGNSGPHGTNNYVKGGGGGAATAGAPQGPSPLSPTGGVGGAGLQVNIDTNNYYWAGGGGGSAWVCGPDAAPGGIGGGGGGSTPPSNSGSAGTGGGSAINAGGAGVKGGAGGSGGANTGGGGGANNNDNSPSNSGAGGSGIVIIRYKFQ
jgi:hypothetical protein